MGLGDGLKSGREFSDDVVMLVGDVLQFHTFHDMVEGTRELKTKTARQSQDQTPATYYVKL